MQTRPQATLLYMTVDIGDGRQDILHISPEDDPKALSQQFAAKHKLSKEMTAKLQGLIRSNQEAAKRYQADQSQPFSPLQGLSRTQFSESALLSRRRGRRPPSVHEDKDVTFHPKVNSPARRPVKTEELLLKKGKQLLDKREEIRNYYLSEELKDCTFQPQIDHRSLKLSSKAVYSSPRHELLYQDAQTRQDVKRETYLYTVKTEHPYHPQINDRSADAETREQIFTRLTQARRRTSSDSVPEPDMNQSDAYFHPLTGRGPSRPEYMRKQPVHEHLYELRARKNQVTEDLRSRLEEQRPFYTSFTTKKSDQIVRNSRRRQLEKIFRALDADRDGVISFDTLAIEEVDERALRLLSPIWEQMQEKGVEYDLEGFLADAETVCSVLSVEERDYLLKVNSNPRPQPLPQEQKPRLNQISRILAAERFADADLYTKQLQDKEQAALKTAQLKASLEAQQLSECTFRPATTKYTRK